MRIRVVGLGEYRKISFEFDVLRSTTVMMVKVQIMRRFQIQPSEQTLLYKGVELQNMQNILDCGIKPTETIELSPTEHLVTANLHYGGQTVRVDVKPTATMLGLKNLLATKVKDRFDVNKTIVVSKGQILANDKMTSSLECDTIYVTYPQIQFLVHLLEGSIRTISLTYQATVGDLRQEKICNEDPNLLILETDNAIVAEDDFTPLYATSFLESNILRITFLSITEVVRRVRRLEQQKHEEQLRSQAQSSLVEKYKDTIQRSEIALDQIRATVNSMTQRQTQQIDSLKGSIQLLQNRLQVVSPRFEEISALEKHNAELKQRIDQLVQSHARETLPDASAEVLNGLQKRVAELEKRLIKVSSASGKARITPPPLPQTAIPIKEEKGDMEGKDEKGAKKERYFMPRLRKAFASPKLPSFVVNAVKNRKKGGEKGDVVCTLPPYSKM